jgi:hypothetical protein
MGKDKTLVSYFQKIAANFEAMFSGLGGIIGELVKLGADENIGIFFNKIKEATPAIGEMLGKFTPVLPAVGDLFVAIIDIINALADTDAPKLFFETLTKAAEAMVPLLQDEGVQAILNVTGQVHALGLAFQTIKAPVEQVIGFMFGNLISILDTIDKLKKGFGNVKTIIEGIPAVYEKIKIFSKAALDDAKIGLQLYAQAAKDFFNKAKDYAKSMFDQAKAGFNLYKEQAKGAFNSAKQYAIGMFDQAKIGFKLLIDKAKLSAIAVGNSLKTAFLKAAAAAKLFATNVFLGTKAMLLQAIQGAKNIGVMLAQRAATIGAAIAQGVLRVATVIGTAVQAAFNFVLALNPITLIVIAIVALIAALIYFFTQTELGKQIFQGFMDFMAGVFDFLMDAFKAVGDFFVAMWDGVVKGLGGAIKWFGDMFKGVWDGIVGFFKGIVNGLIGMFEGFINFVIDGLNGFLGPMKDAINGVMKFLGIPLTFSAIGKVSIPRLADGGVVMPSAGGSLVNVAEAGKPEKVVPLDSEGLSAGDRKVLEALNSSTGINIQINGAEMDKNELAAEVSRRLAFQMRKGAI